MTELCDKPAVELRRLIAARELSPVELLTACHARIDAANPALNAIVAEDRTAARQAAEAAEAAVGRGEALGLLHGLPVAIKDMNETAGLRTTFGSPIYRDFTPEKDDAVVATIRRAGAVILGKANTPEFAAGANTDNPVYGYTGNAFDPNRSAAGSSGGSAVALAASMAPLANGSDLGGSLRTPAAYNGVYGLRPTAGRVPSVDDTTPFLPLSVEGPMARSLPDLALFFAALARFDRRDPASRPVSWEDFIDPAPADLSQLKIAFSDDLGFAPLDDTIREVFHERKPHIAKHFHAAQDRDPDLGEAMRIFETLRGVMFLAGLLGDYRAHPDLIGPNVKANIELGLALKPEDIGWAMAEHAKLFRRFVGFMEEVDVLVAPAAAVTPFEKPQSHPLKINGRPLETYVSWMGLTFGLTLTCHPVICMPCGLDHAGMPFGIQLVGRRHGEAKLLSIARALESELGRETSTKRPLPDLERLANLSVKSDV